jgi:tryptophan synthase alpha chain
VREAAMHADGVVVGSAVVDQLAASLNQDGDASASTVSATLALAKALAEGRHRQA